MISKVLWKYASLVYGGLSAVMDGAILTLVLCAGNLDMTMKVLYIKAMIILMRSNCLYFKLIQHLLIDYVYKFSLLAA